MLELRGIVPSTSAERPTPARRASRSSGATACAATTRIRATPEPRPSTDGSLVFDLDLEPRGAIDLEVDFEVSEHERRRGRGPARRAGATRTARVVTSDDQLFNRILARSLARPRAAPLRARRPLVLRRRRAVVRHPVRARQPDHLVPDALVRARDRGGDAAAAGGPARAGVQRRARRGAGQGAPRAARGRAGDISARRRSPATTAPWTPRRCSSACSASHADWSGNLDLFRELRGPAEAALEWIDRYADLDGDGLVEYQRRSPHGLVTQGWKDSADGIPDDEGEPLTGPVALVEVQGYVSRAKRLMARMFELDGDGARAERLRDEASAVEAAARALLAPGPALLRDRARRRQAPRVRAHLEPGPPALVEQRERRACPRDPRRPDVGRDVHRLGSANAGVEPSRLQPRRLPHRLRLAARQRADRVRAAPLRVRRGLHAIFEGLLEAASRFDDYRLPELFAGFPRAEFDEPVPYPVACQPQAWAAGSIPFLLKWGLGPEPGRARQAARDRAAVAAALAEQGRGHRAGARRRQDRPRLRARGRPGDAGRRANRRRRRGGARDRGRPPRRSGTR